MKYQKLLFLCIFAGLLGSLASLFIPYVNTDEGAWAVMSQYAFSGDLYSLYTDHKPPGLYQIYWIFSLGANYPAATHWLTSVWMGVGAFFLFLFLRRRFPELNSAVVSVFVSLLNPLVNMGSFSAERAYLPFIFISLWLAEKKDYRIEVRALLVGVLLGLASAIKQPAAVLGLVPVFILLSQDKKLRVFFIGLVAGSLSIVFTWLLSGVSFETIWSQAYFANISYVEAGEQSLEGMWKEHLKNAGLVIGIYFLPLLLGSGIALRSVLQTEKAFFVVFFFLCSIVPVVLGGRFYQNYFVNLLPFLAYASAPFWSLRRAKWGMAVALVIALSFNVRTGLMQLQSNNKNWDPFVHKLVAKIKEDTESDDRIWISHNLFSVYFESGRRSSTPLIFFHHVLGYIDICRVEDSLLEEDLSNKNYRDLLEDLATNPPKVIFWPQRNVNSCTDRLDLESFPAIYKILQNEYQKTYEDELGIYYLRL